MAVDAELAFDVAHHSNMVTFIHSAGQRDGIAVGIYHLTSNLLLGTHNHHTHDKKYNAKKSLHLYNLFIMSSNSLYCFALQSYT